MTGLSDIEAIVRFLTDHGFPVVEVESTQGKLKIVLEIDVTSAVQCD